MQLTTPIVEWFRERKFPVPEHYNQSVMLRASKRLNPHTLEASLRVLCACHEMLRATWNGYGLTIRPLETARLIGFWEHDFAGEVDPRVDVLKAAQRLQAEVDLANGPLMRAALFHMKDGDAVLIAIHHLVVDGVSWRVLTEDLASVYEQLLTGAFSARLQRPRCTFAEYAGALGAYAKGETLARELPYWKSVAEKVSKGVVKSDKSAKSAFLTVSVPAETTKALLTTAAAKLSAEANDLLLTALARAWKKVTGRGGLAVSLEGHGREAFGEKPLAIERVIGWFTTIYPVALSATDGEATDDLLATAQMLRASPGKGFGYGALRYLGGHAELAVQTEFTFNYLGSFDEGASDKALFAMDRSLPQGDAVSPENAGETPFALNCLNGPDGLTGRFDYDTSLMDEEKAKAFAAAFVQELSDFAHA